MALLITDSYDCNPDEYRYDPVLIGMILQKCSSKEIHNYAKQAGIRDHTKKYWLKCLMITWLPVGTFFTITRCGDNGESIVTVQLDTWEQA
jgi:hypothetical protein